MRHLTAREHAVSLDAGSDSRRTFVERRQSGQALRQRVPRRAHAAWSPAPARPDPVRTLADTGRHRIQSLLPIRYRRMRRDPLGFMRGAAAVMAADLATTPACGLFVQACGDAHLGNFGTYASPEGTPVFDITDFDETLAAPFEWDVKRLAVSFAVAARCRGLADKHAAGLAGEVCRAYRERMGELTRMAPLDAWRARIEVAEVLATIGDRKLREREVRRLHAATAASQANFPKLIERRRGAWRIRLDERYTFRLAGDGDSTLEDAARTAFASYRGSLRPEQHLLVERYHLADLAFKVVGVGSVGTFCAIGLFTTADGAVLLLQLKEAQASVLAPFAGPSPYHNHGLRVVAGQRIMQAVTDPFLGWTRDDGDDRPCYVRQLKDSRMAMLGETLADTALGAHAQLCGRALARAHARSQDAARLWGYMGASGAFDAAIAEFAMRYADQTERDHRLFLDAIEAGGIEAAA